MAREDNFTATVEAAAAHAALFDDGPWNDAPDPADVGDHLPLPATAIAVNDDPWHSGADSGPAPF